MISTMFWSRFQDWIYGYIYTVGREIAVYISGLVANAGFSVEYNGECEFSDMDTSGVKRYSYYCRKLKTRNDFGTIKTSEIETIGISNQKYDKSLYHR